MTTYRDMSTLAPGAQVIFLGNVGINPLEPGSSQFELMIPNGTVMDVVDNKLLEPEELLVLRPDSAVFQKVVDKWNPAGTVNLGPEMSGPEALDEIAPVDVIE